MVHRPEWFKDGHVFVSYAETVGINKDGNNLYIVDSLTGQRTEDIDDKVTADIDALTSKGGSTATSRWVPATDFRLAVPTYYDDRYTKALGDLLRQPGFESFEVKTLGELVKTHMVVKRAGHGSPSADMRNGTVPYIKVSDIRAGQVNINPSNLVPNVIAERFWKDKRSGLEPFDLITPVRSSKNIGEFAVMMPGQEQVVLTKEMLILRADPKSGIDNFYLLWALSLKVVRDQWKRLVFMQTNREDVGDRYLEVEIPWPTDVSTANALSQNFRDYYIGMETLRTKFVDSLDQDNLHHVFLGSSADPIDDVER